MTHEQEKNQFIEADPEMTEMVERDIKTPVISMFHMLKDLKKHTTRVRKEIRHKNSKRKLRERWKVENLE